MNKLNPLIREQMRVNIRLMWGLRNEVTKETKRTFDQILSEPMRKYYIEETINEVVTLSSTTKPLNTS